MGYRTYIGEIPKKEYNKIKSMNVAQISEYYNESIGANGHWYKGVYDIVKKLYEFGKYTDFNPPKKSMKKFFKNKELREKYEEHDFYVATKEFLEYLINNYKEKIAKYYNEMMLPFLDKRDKMSDIEKPSTFLKSIKTNYSFPDDSYTFDFSLITNDEQTALFKIIQHIRSFRSEWTVLTPFDLEKGDEITTSWKFEYGVFELVRIYKHFDWKRNFMVYYGY